MIMKLTKSLLCAALLVGVSSAAMADFSGFYMGPQVSYAWMNTTSTPQNDTYTDVDSLSNSLTGFSVGPHLGYAYQLDQWVFAVEGSYSGGSFTDKETGAGTTDSYTTKVSQIYTVTPLIGYTVDDWMFYGKGGYISGKLDVDAKNSETSLNNSERQYGVTAGLGFAYQFAGNNSIGLEYDYSRLAKTEFNNVDVGVINMNSISLIYSRYF